MALLTIYFGRLLALARAMFTQWQAARFVIGVLLAFLPAAAVGALAGSVIKAYLFDVRIVCTTLILGGFVLLWVDRLNLRARHHDATAFTLPMYFGIGVLQCLAMIPGVSRAGATIMGARVFRVDRATAAEFSFFLAMPTMLGATVYDLYKNWSSLSWDHGGVIALGFVAAFVSAMLVVRAFVWFISRHGFTAFAWYRIAVGALALTLLLMR
jgi:undecaprenyl-diphosphatase